jgi:hypothetical protein
MHAKLFLCTLMSGLLTIGSNGLAIAQQVGGTPSGDYPPYAEIGACLVCKIQYVTQDCECVESLGGCRSVGFDYTFYRCMPRLAGDPEGGTKCTRTWGATGSKWDCDTNWDVSQIILCLAASAACGASCGACAAGALPACAVCVACLAGEAGTGACSHECNFIDSCDKDAASQSNMSGYGNGCSVSGECGLQQVRDQVEIR